VSELETLHVVFEVGGAGYVLPATVVRELESLGEVTPVPGAPPHVAGIVHIRGQVIALVDLRVRFGLPPAGPSLDRRVIVVEHERRRVGLLVDLAREIARIPPAAFDRPPDMVAEHAGGLVKAVARHGSRLLMLLDCERALEQEQR